MDGGHVKQSRTAKLSGYPSGGASHIIVEANDATQFVKVDETSAH